MSKLTVRIPSIALLLSCLVFGQAALHGNGNEEVQFEPLAPARVVLSGTSTVHNWQCIGDRVDGIIASGLDTDEFHRLVRSLLTEGNGVARNHGNDHYPAPTIRMRFSIENLECANPRKRRDLFQAVRAKEHPEIIYSFQRADGAFSVENNGSNPLIILPVVGEITVGGVSRTVSHDVTIRVLERDKFEISGSLDLKMSDFDITPPTALFGLIRAHDPLSVEYRFTARSMNGVKIPDAGI